MTASQIIGEIKRLDPKDQLGVIRFAYQLDAKRHLTGSELSSLAERMVNTTDVMEAARQPPRCLEFGGEISRRHYWSICLSGSAAARLARTN